MPFWKIYNKNKILRKDLYIENNQDEMKFAYPIPINFVNPKRAVLSASMTLEAAFIVPLFLFFSIILIYIINLVHFQSHTNEVMYDVSRNLSKLEYSMENSANAGTAMAMLHGQLDGSMVDKIMIRGGRMGITFLSSDFEEDMIRLEIHYIANVPFDFLKIMDLSCTQKICIRKWIGNEDKGDGEGGDASEEERMVYITETGSVYHTNRNCTHLMLSKKTVSYGELEYLRNSGGGKYHACEMCVGKQGSGTVYITDWGDRYHLDGNCSGLKRGVLLVPYEEVVGWSQCMRCQEG